MWRSVTDALTGTPTRASLSLLALVAGVYARAIGFDFVRWDDPVNVTHNPLITEPWSWDLIARLTTGETALRFKPLPWLLYRLTHAGFGFNPAAWHALNLLLHLGATLMFGWVLRETFARMLPGIAREDRDFGAWLGAAAWAVHPAHVEAACWVTATPYPLMVIFLLASFRCYLRAFDPGSPTRRWLGWSWGWALASYASYPVGVTYALWLVVTDLWLLRTAPTGHPRAREWPRWCLRHAVFLLPAVVSVAVTWQSSDSTPWLYPAPPTLAEVGGLERLKMAAAVLGAIWTHFLWPFGFTPNNPILSSAQIQSGTILAFAAGATTLTLVALGWHRKAPAVAGVIVGVAALSLPVLGFAQWPHWSVADRYVYLPHLVIAGAMAGAAIRWRARHAAHRAVVSGAMLLGLAALALLGWRQVNIWRDTDTLFRYLERQPAFTWNPAQQAYIYQLWAAQATDEGDAERAHAKHTQARQALQVGMFAAAEAQDWPTAVDLSYRLEQAYGLPPALRQLRRDWLQKQGRASGMGAVPHKDL